MFRQPVNPFFIRNNLMGLGVVLLLIGILMRPQVLLFFLSLDEAIRLGIMILVALFSAIQIYALFEPRLPWRGSPFAWYTRPNGFLAVILGVALFVSVSFLMDRIAYLALHVGPMLPAKSDLCTLGGMMFLWTVRLAWFGTRF